MRGYFLITCFTCISVSLFGQVALDDNHHGDPPFLSEVGWIPLINGKDMGGWMYEKEEKANSWVAAKVVYWDQAKNPKLLTAISGTGDRILNLPCEGGAGNIISEQTMGNMELYIEFMIPEGAGSGIYVHGLYELQIWDSYGIEPRLPSDKTGTIYAYANRQGAIVPTIRAERPHGQWNAFHIWYQAPKFDTSGKKIENAKFIRILLNGVLIHENQERTEGTHACLEIPEAAKNPAVMLQGGYGSVAFRNIYVKPLN